MSCTKEKTGEWPAPAQVENPDDDGFSNNVERPASREARRDTLKQAAQFIQNRVVIGGATSGDLTRARKPVLEAELELARNQEERIAILERILEGQIEIEEVQRIRREVGTGGELDFFIAKAGREEAAINLYKARKGTWPLSSGRGEENPCVAQKPEDSKLRTLLAEHRDTLKKIVSVFDKYSRNGAALIVDAIAANEALFEAEIELVKSPHEQVAILQEALEKQTEVESIADAKVKAATGDRTELLIAKAARLKVEIALHKARKKAK